jgi:hypothetical protein
MDSGWGYAVCAAIAAAIGFAELVTRYRDRPSDLFTSAAAWMYLALNAAASMAALLLVRSFGWDFGASGSVIPLVQVLVAGFGSLALFRSSLFTVRVGDADVNIGPSTLLTMALNAADLGVNRHQAKLRSKFVTKSFAKVDFDRAKTALPVYCLNLMEGVPADDQKRLSDEVATLDAAEISKQMKTYNLGVALLRVTGTSILRTAVSDTGSEIRQE